MKLYIAGKFEERLRIRNIMEQMISYGHTITYDWTQHIKGDSDIVCAIQDLKGVKECDALLAIVDNNSVNYRGTFCEIGAALVLGKPVFLYGNAINSCTFRILCKQIGSLEQLKLRE